MNKNETFTKIEKCVRNLHLAIEAYQNFLSARTSSDTKSYYHAQNCFNEGKTIYQDSLNEISKIMGSIPTDASPAFRKWKVSFLEKMGILSQSTEFEALRSEIQCDEFLPKFLTAEEIEILLVKHFESQQAGKRKLSNIKARILFDKIQSLMDEAETLSRRSKEKLYQLR